MVVNLLRANVNHYSFVTGILEGKSINVNVILNANVTEGYKLTNVEESSREIIDFDLRESPSHNILRGSLGQCCDLISFITGGNKTSIKENDPDDSNRPTEFTIETWEASKEDSYKWQLKSETHWKGVKWINARHTGDGGDRMCAGIATFTAESKEIKNIDNGRIVEIPKFVTNPCYNFRITYPSLYLRRILQKEIPEPRHHESYAG